MAVKRKYALTVDGREVRALQGVLAGCDSTALVFSERGSQAPGRAQGGTAADAEDALRRWDTNANGRISCKEARQHGIAPVRRGHPAYRHMRDGDGDGVVCE